MKTKIKDILMNRKDSEEYVFDCFLSRPNKRVATNGKPFLNLHLVDETGQIAAKKWNVSPVEEQNLIHGNFFEITGKFSIYNDLPQIVILDWKVISDPELKSSLLPSAPYSIEAMWKEFSLFIDQIKDADYSKLIKYIFQGETLADFKKTYAGLRVHHNVNGGLLWHTLSILKMAEKMMKIYDYSQINKSLLYAGIMLHDIGKIYEIGSGNNEKYSLEGKLLGHITIGASIVKKYGEELNISAEKIDFLQHMILASHGKLENGSPVTPVLLEAFVLAQLDDFDAKFNSIWKELEQVPQYEFTNKVFAMNNTHFYRLSPLKDSEK